LGYTICKTIQFRLFEKNSPNVPILAEDIIQMRVLCEKVGAFVVDIHARNPVVEIPSTGLHILCRANRVTARIVLIDVGL